MIRITQQVTDGRAAFDAGAALDANPCKPGTVGWNDWEIGYLGAQLAAAGRAGIAEIRAALVKANPWMRDQ